jgi:biotin carboxyl carrier protein
VEQDREDGGQRPGRRVIARLADELLPVLIARLEASTLGELEVREDGWRVRLRRPHNGDKPAPAPARVGAAVEGSADHPPSPTAQRPERERTQLTSPAVGYFVPRDGLSAGTSLRGGDVIGHIDVLGVQQEVVMPEDGILARIDVEPGQAVEYGQPIARLEPETRG